MCHTFKECLKSVMTLKFHETFWKVKDSGTKFVLIAVRIRVVTPVSQLLKLHTFEEGHLLGYGAVWSDSNLPTLQRCLLRPYLWLR